MYKKKKIPQTFGRHVQLFSLHFLKGTQVSASILFGFPDRSDVPCPSFSVKCVSLSAHQRLEGVILRW